MPPYTISEDNLLYVNAHSDACGSEKKCYILQGIIDDKFLHENVSLRELYMPKLTVVGDEFLFNNTFSN